MQRHLAVMALSSSSLLFCAFVFMFPLNDDVLWYTYIAREIVFGKATFWNFYEHYREINFPLITYLSIPAAALGAWVPPSLAVKLWFTFLCLSLLALFYGFRLGKGSLFENDKNALFCGFTISLLTLFCFNPEVYNLHLFQREFFIGLALLLLLFSFQKPWTDKQNIEFVRVVLACLIIGLKPFYLIAVLSLYIVHFIYYRRVSVRSLFCVFLFSGLYAAFTWYALPAYREILLTHQKVYQGLNIPWQWIIFDYKTICFLLLAFIYGWHLWRRNRPLSPLPMQIIFSSLACLSLIVWQGKGYMYHYLPLFMLALVMLYSVLASGTSFKGRFAIVIALNIVGILYGIRNYSILQASENLQVTAFLQKQENLRSYYFLSTANRVSARPLNQNFTQWGARFYYLWFLPHFLHQIDSYEDDRQLRDSEAKSPLLQERLTMLFQDLELSRPEFIAVDASEYLYGFALSKERRSPTGKTSFRLLAYLSRFARFRAFWQKYKKIKRIGTIEIYQRQD